MFFTRVFTRPCNPTGLRVQRKAAERREDSSRNRRLLRRRHLDGAAHAQDRAAADAGGRSARIALSRTRLLVEPAVFEPPAIEEPLIYGSRSYDLLPLGRLRQRMIKRFRAAKPRRPRLLGSGTALSKASAVTSI
jgi:hypothetical protein